MSRIESNITSKRIKKIDSKKAEINTKVWAALTLLGLTGLLTFSYMNDNIFIEHLAICAFIISCIAIIKLITKQ